MSADIANRARLQQRLFDLLDQSHLYHLPLDRLRHQEAIAAARQALTEAGGTPGAVPIRQLDPAKVFPKE